MRELEQADTSSCGPTRSSRARRRSSGSSRSAGPSRSPRRPTTRGRSGHRRPARSGMQHSTPTSPAPCRKPRRVRRPQTRALRREGSAMGRVRVGRLMATLGVDRRRPVQVNPEHETGPRRRPAQRGRPGRPLSTVGGQSHQRLDGLRLRLRRIHRRLLQPSNRRLAGGRLAA
jgi:hypothetical protein